LQNYYVHRQVIVSLLLSFSIYLSLALVTSSQSTRKAIMSPSSPRCACTLTPRRLPRTQSQAITRPDFERIIPLPTAPRFKGDNLRTLKQVTGFRTEEPPQSNRQRNPPPSNVYSACPVSRRQCSLLFPSNLIISSRQITRPELPSKLHPKPYSLARQQCF
jgi:hypothetical protein